MKLRIFPLVVVGVFLGFPWISVAQPPKLLHKLRHGTSVGAVTFTPDGRTVIAGGYAYPFSDIIFWDVKTGREIGSIDDRQTGFDHLPLTPDGKSLIAKDKEGIQIWDIKTRKPKTFLSGKYVSCFALGKKGRKLAVGCLSNGAIVKLWDLKTKKVKTTLTTGKAATSAVALSPDGKFVAVDRDRATQLWDLKTKKVVRTFEHSFNIYRLAFSPDGKTLAGAQLGSYGGVQIWDAKTGKLLKTLRNDAGVNCLAFSPNGRALVSGGLKARLWNVATGKELCTLDGHKQNIKCVAFSPDGKKVATGSQDKRVCIWDVSKFLPKK
ncbi:MAG: WD40 repeat domain-containing protein [Gemmataceae bacterium]